MSDYAHGGTRYPRNPSEAVSARSVAVQRADIDRLEDAGDMLMRAGYPHSAVDLYALALRFRTETRWPSRNALIEIGGDS